MNNSSHTQSFVVNGGGQHYLGIVSAGINTSFMAKGAAPGENPGIIVFYTDRTADHGTFIQQPGAYGGGYVRFGANATGGNANFINNGGDATGDYPGAIAFFDQSNAGSATITLNGVNGIGGNARGGHVDFEQQSNAAAATLIANTGTQGGAGGAIYFSDDAVGAVAHIHVIGNGFLDISYHNTTGITIQSMEGTGNVFLGGNNLTVDLGNDPNTNITFSGSIHDGGANGGTGGSFGIKGQGTMKLSGTLSFTGPIVIDGHPHDLAMFGEDVDIFSPVSILRGIFQWTAAHIRSDVNVAPDGTAYGGGGGIRGVAPGRPVGSDYGLTVDGNYTQQSGGKLQLDVDGVQPGSYAHVDVAGGITLVNGAVLELNFLAQFAPHAGDTFDLLTGNSMSGSFTTVRLNGLAPGFNYNLGPDGNGHFRLIALNDAQPLVQSAVSRKNHGGTNFDINILSSTGTECRSGGATNDYTIVTTFGSSITVTGSPQAQVTSGTGIIGSGGASNGGSVSVSGNTVTVPLTNVANAQTIEITLNGVNTGSSISDAFISMKVLVGDANGNGTVNATDAALAKSRIGQGVSGTNFRSDVNANGTVNATDVALIKSKIGTALP